MPLPERCVIVFDLDDTLYPEREFVRSGFRAAAQVIERETGADVYRRLSDLFEEKHCDPFAAVIAEFRLPGMKPRLVDAYREHVPNLILAAEVRQLLTDLRLAGHAIGIMTDGRSRTQRNKIRVLGLESWATAVLISDEFGSAKPAERNYRHFEHLFGGRRFAYVGDNLAKDFVTANWLGWQTVCVLNRGAHIHPQRFDEVPAEALPQYVIERLA